MGDFDIVIAVGPNDSTVIEKQIVYTKKNIIGYRNIYLVAAEASLTIEGCITIDERIYPFTIEDVVKMGGSGWYLQQLLKLYAGIVIPGIMDKYLVIDSDTYFLTPIRFEEDGKTLFDVGLEYNQQYFVHMDKLHPSLKKYYKYLSGITHHMMFETKYVQELFHLVETYHCTSSKEHTPFYTIFLSQVENFRVSGASEYEIYFNFMLGYHKDQIKIRFLKWKNVDTENFYKILGSTEDHGIMFVSWHWYKR